MNTFLICGLGSLGQHCALHLKKFARHEAEVRVTGVDASPLVTWDVPCEERLFDGGLFIGDCRQEEVLEKAGIRFCRTALFVTSTESVNVAAALVARRLNPRLRVVVRSSRDRLNELLGSRIPNWAALDPTELPAPAFALSALHDGTLGVFSAGNHVLRIVEREIGKGDPLEGVPVHRLHREGTRLLSLARPAEKRFSPATAFFQWEPEAVLREGDVIALVETHTEESGPKTTDSAFDWEHIRSFYRTFLRGGLASKFSGFFHWIEADRTRMLTGAGCLLAAFLWLTGTLILKGTIPKMSWLKATSSGVILMLGGFGDVFGGLQEDPVPWWVALVCLLITLTSILFILGVFGLIADRILSLRIDLVARRGRIPRSGHFIIVGFGRVGRRVAEFITQVLKLPVLCLTAESDSIIRLPGAGFLSGDHLQQLGRAHVERARGLVAVTDDEVLNLEAALLAVSLRGETADPLGISIRVMDAEFGRCLYGLLPRVQAFSAYALSAEAFASAAYGENVTSLFQLNGRTVLVTEFEIAQGDTLEGLTMGDAAYGFGVVPIFHRPAGFAVHEARLMPPDEGRLQNGDRLTVLSTLNGLRRIERNESMARVNWRLRAVRPLGGDSAHAAASIIRNMTGLALADAREFIGRLPERPVIALYEYPASRLGKMLAPFGIELERLAVS